MDNPHPRPAVVAHLPGPEDQGDEVVPEIEQQGRNREQCCLPEVVPKGRIAWCDVRSGRRQCQLRRSAQHGTDDNRRQVAQAFPLPKASAVRVFNRDTKQALAGCLAIPLVQKPDTACDQYDPVDRPPGDEIADQRPCCENSGGSRQEYDNPGEDAVNEQR